MTSFNKYKKALEKRNSVLKKQNAIYHNAFMEINLLLCQDFSAEQRLKNIISVVQVSRIDVAMIAPTSTVVLV
jgi:hypothetical protein